jgi:HlyD family secretion protein
MTRPTAIVFRTLAGAGLAFLVALAATGCSRSSAAPEASAAQAATPGAPSTVHPQRRTLTKVIEQPGQIEGYETTTLSVKVPGHLKEWLVDIKDHVHEGDLLAVLEAPEMIREVQQKEALVKQAEAQVILAQRVLEATDATVARAEANIRLAEASKGRTKASVIRREADLERAQRLFRTSSIEREKLDQAMDDNEAALAADAETDASIVAMKAAKKESLAQREKALADVEVAKTKVAVARADFEHARANASYLDIYAPYDGVITQRLGNIGDLLQPNGKSVVFTMTRVDTVRVWVDVPETEAVHIARGQTAWVRLPSLDEQEFQGVVTRDTHSVDSQSRTLRLQIDLPNPDERLRPGVYATGRLLVAHPDVWTVPVSAVWVQDDQPMVVRIENGVARRTPVRTGLTQGGFVQLFKKQVRVVPRGEPLPWEDWTGEEEIVVENPGGVAEGQPVARR